MDEIVKYVAQGGGVGLLALYIVLHWRRVIVWGTELTILRGIYTELLTRAEASCAKELIAARHLSASLEKDRDDWKKLTLELLQHANKAIDVAQAVSKERQ